MMNYLDCSLHKLIISYTTFDTKNTVETNTGNNTPMHSLKHMHNRIVQIVVKWNIHSIVT